MGYFSFDGVEMPMELAELLMDLLLLLLTEKGKERDTARSSAADPRSTFV